MNTITQMKLLSDSTLLYGFCSSDSIYKFNFKTGQYILEANFNTASNFRKNNKKKKTDLGYLRWQEVTNEENLKLFQLEDGDYFILKKLRREELHEKSTLEFFVLDKNDFSITSNNLFPKNLLTSSCLPYKKGIIIFSDSLQKAYYYEL